MPPKVSERHPEIPPISQEQDSINLLNALRIAFSKDGDPEVFLARASEQSREVEAAIIDTCAKNRIRIDDNLYALLESRDAISEQTHELEKSTRIATEVTDVVNRAVVNLAEKMQIRENLDAALAVAAQTRRLTRMYARVEDTIDSRRLYTAYRMLKMLEEETRTVQPHTILQELVPDARRLRTQIVLHARKGSQSWLTTVCSFERALGEFALHHAATQAFSYQTLLDTRRSALTEPFALLPAIVTTTPKNRRASRPWIPLLTQSPVPEPIRFSNRSAPRGVTGQMLAVPGPTYSFDGNVRPDIGRDLRSLGGDLRRSHTMVLTSVPDIPTLYLRPLLQCALVSEGLDLLPDLRSDYRRERRAHLERVLNGTDDSEAAAKDDADFSPPSVLSRARRLEILMFKVVGFFVVERAVEHYAAHHMVARSVVDGEWWALAHGKLASLLREFEENRTESDPDRSRVRRLEENLESFALEHGLELVFQGDTR